MKNKVLIIGLSIFLLPLMGMAQKVSKGANGHLILHLDAKNGMPVGSFTSTSKTEWFEGKSTNNSAWTSSAENQSAGIINATVFQKLELAPRDISSSSQIVAGGGRQKMTWATAANTCRNLVYGGHDDWRLPTQKEILLIYVMSPIIATFLAEDSSLQGFYDTDDNINVNAYWCLTEQSSSSAWRVYFKNGGCYSTGKSSGQYFARCVREVVD
ncbi:MAG: DUF1566 domain-containing protein [Mangrovibacterium sp.]